jgi:hypothetical protein
MLNSVVFFQPVVLDHAPYVLLSDRHAASLQLPRPEAGATVGSNDHLPKDFDHSPRRDVVWQADSPQQRRCGGQSLPLEPLLLCPVRLCAQIHDLPSGKRVLADPSFTHQPREEMCHIDQQPCRQFDSGAAGRRLFDAGEDRVAKRAGLGEANVPPGPQTPVIERRDVVQNVVHAVVVVARQVALFLQGPDDSHVRDAELPLQLRQGGNFLPWEPANDVLFGFCEHGGILLKCSSCSNIYNGTL